MITQAQERVLRTLARGPRTSVGVAQTLNAKVANVQHTLDGLFRRSLVTLDSRSRWMLTERGAKKVQA